MSEALPLGHGASLICTCVVDQVDTVQNGCRPRMLYTAFNRRYMWFGSRPRPNNQPSPAITAGAGRTFSVVHLRYCVGAAELVFSDEMNEALLYKQQADVFTWNHCGEDAYNDLNHFLKLSIPFSHFQIQKSCTLSQIRELRENTLVHVYMSTWVSFRNASRCKNRLIIRWKPHWLPSENTTKWDVSCENQRSGFRPGPTQTRLYSHRRWLEAWNFGFKRRGIVISV